MSGRDPAAFPRTRWIAELLFGGLGVVALVWAWRMNPTWFELHFTPAYCALRAADRARAVPWRWGLGIAGAVLLLVVRPLAARWAGRRSARGAIGSIAPVALAVLLALVFCEVLLRHKKAHAAQDPDWFALPPADGDVRLGWRIHPGTTTTLREGGRDIVYAIDANRFRVPTEEQPVDPALPSILFPGESIAFGLGVQYDETYPAIVGKALGVQSVNAAMFGYAHDQAYVAMLDALAVLQHPVAIVMPAMTVQLDRDTAWDRNTLTVDGDGALRPRPLMLGVVADSPLVDLWRRVVPYHDLWAVDVAHAIFTATAKIARERGAYPLLLVTNYREPCLPGPDGAVAAERLMLDGLDVDMVRVPLDPSWIVDTDVHPDLRAHRKLADAVIAALKGHVPVATP
jgi:hypothetical protein